MSTQIFSLRDVEKHYASAGTEFRLSIPCLDIAAGSKLAFIGESGSGKSTLLELLAMILAPTSSARFDFQPGDNNDRFDIKATWEANDADLLSDLRSHHLGYVLQYGGLLPYLTVRENINLSRRLLKRRLKKTAEHWADRLNIRGQLGKRPSELSVGQRQRVAIARALAHEPNVLIADEPTASVDPVNAEKIMELMVGLVDEAGVTLIVASHAHRLMQSAGLEMINHRIDMVSPSSMHVTVQHGSA